MTTYTHTIIDGRLFMDVQQPWGPERYEMVFLNGQIEFKEIKPMNKELTVVRAGLNDMASVKLTKEGKARIFNKRMKGFEGVVMSNFEKSELAMHRLSDEPYTDALWSIMAELGGGMTAGGENLIDMEYGVQFRFEKDSTPPPKREPRRVWVNYCKDGTPGNARESADLSKVCAHDSWCSEYAVEFVEVMKS